MDTLDDEIRLVTKAAAAGRPLTRRVHAFFVPTDGVRWWNRWSVVVADAPGRWLNAALDRLPRPGGRP